jgi:hypothetical protein
MDSNYSRLQRAITALEEQSTGVFSCLSRQNAAGIFGLMFWCVGFSGN